MELANQCFHFIATEKIDRIININNNPPFHKTSLRMAKNDSILKIDYQIFMQKPKK